MRRREERRENEARTNYGKYKFDSIRHSLERKRVVERPDLVGEGESEL